MKNKCKCLSFLFAVMMVLPGYALSATKKPTTMAELAMYKGADRQQILEEGAKKEGKLTFYTSGILKQAVNPVVEAFQKKYPFIKVDIWRASSMELVSRATEEFRAGRHMLDVMEGTQTNMIVIQEVGIVQPFFSPNLVQVDDEAKTNAPGGAVLAVAFRSSGIGFGYNTNLVKKEQLPKTYNDLLNPFWKGKLAIAGSDTGVNWMSAIYRNLGEDLLKKIANQGFPVQMISGQAMLDMVISGEYAASPTIFDSHVVGSKKRGAPCAWVPLEPVRVNVGPIAVTKNAPHPYTALLFADFETSKESGDIHRSVGYDSTRKDVPPLEQRYKKYYGQDTVQAVKEEHDLFDKLFVKK
jgi:iron(III) transport system substrate-binding protein